MNILIGKMGSVYKTRARAIAASAVGEQGETEGIIHHLLKNPDINLIFFGKYDGEVPEGLTVIQPDIKGLDEWSTSKEQKRRWANDIAALEPYAPFAGFIQIAGYSGTMSFIDNPNGATVQLCAIKYAAPQINVMDHFKVPRLMINCDPRNYPKDQEMTLVTDWARPRALLDQVDDTYITRVGGLKYRRVSVYAGCERWAKLVPSPPVDRDLDCTIVAHAHIVDGVAATKSMGPGRHAAWRQVLSPYPDMEDLCDRGMRIYGKGWKHYTGALPDDCLGGMIRPSEVESVLARSKCGPIVSVLPGFYTGKLMVYLAQGCAPLLYGDGSHAHTYDPQGRYWPLNSSWRIRQPGDLKRIVDVFCDDEEVRKLYIAELVEATQPDWTLLDNLVADLLADKELGERYGGYFK